MRLLSLAPSNTEILYALGLGDSVIGVTAFCDYPIETRSKPKVGGWTSPLPEKIRTLRPDLIFTSYFLPPELRDWKDSGTVLHVAPKTLHDVYESILEIGTKVQRYKEAKEVVKKMKEEFAQIRSQDKLRGARQSVGPGRAQRLLRHRQLADPRNDKVKVYMEEWPASADPTSQDGLKSPMVSGNWVPELVEIAGGVEEIAETGKPSREFAFEELRSFDPDVMIFHWCGYGMRFDKKNVMDRSGWSKLRAVKDNRLFAIDDSLLNRPGPRLVEGARKIQKILSKLNIQQVLLELQ